MPATYLLDTNIVSAAMRAESQALLNRLAALPADRVHLSSIVLSELMTGAEKSPNRAALLADVRLIADGMSPLPYEAQDAEAYARIRAALERRGATIGPMDLLIAAQAVARSLTLVTDNLREFRRVPGLAVENWLR